MKKCLAFIVSALLLTVSVADAQRRSGPPARNSGAAPDGGSRKVVRRPVREGGGRRGETPPPAKPAPGKPGVTDPVPGKDTERR